MLPSTVPPPTFLGVNPVERMHFRWRQHLQHQRLYYIHGPSGARLGFKADLQSLDHIRESAALLHLLYQHFALVPPGAAEGPGDEPSLPNPCLLD